jgi:molecular chaperone DnaK
MNTIIGIDLGTTNSEVAALINGKVKIVGSGYRKMLPSCVGLSLDGKLLVGEAAKNQHLLYPDRTVLAVKRKMGMTEKLALGDELFSPQEISAFILKELVSWAARELDAPPEKAVITVPAYFSDAARQATREAGALAGLEVVRIINEPTAASLAYHQSEETGDTLVYDLGGGTFDVSVVRNQEGVTEVLASHGNNHLGGNDFTERLFEHLARRFSTEHGVDIRKDHPQAASRLWWASEAAKVTLSTEPSAKILEENLLVENGKPLHLSVEITRQEYEELIQSLVASTMESVTKALTEAGITSNDLKNILLVGGATRTPLVQEMLRKRSPAPLHQEVHPDLCVALGAGFLGAQLAGCDVAKELVDITPYSFGISYLGLLGGMEYPHCYKPIVHRNCALPITRTERYFTSYRGQTAAAIQIFQGEDQDALRNIPVGDFLIEGLTSATGDAPGEILCRMHIDLDGILQVSAIEKATGLQKKITIENALNPMSEEEIQEARKRVHSLFETAEETDDLTPEESDAETDDLAGPDVISIESVREDKREAAWSDQVERATKLIVKSRSLLDRMHPDDREEAVDLHEQIEESIRGRKADELGAFVSDLEEIVFFIEGK